MAKTLNELPELTQVEREADTHVRHNGKDYKQKIGTLLTGSASIKVMSGLEVDGVYIVTNDVPETAYQEDVLYLIKFDGGLVDDTLAINIDGLGMKEVKKITPDGTGNLQEGDMQGGQYVPMYYDGTNLILNTPGDSNIVTKHVFFTPSEIEDMTPDQPVDILDAPPAGYFPEFITPPVCWLEYNSTPWTVGSAGPLTINQPSHGTDAVYSIGTSFYSASEQRRRKFAETSQLIYAEKYQAYFDTAAPSGGNSKIHIYLTYRFVKS